MMRVRNDCKCGFLGCQIGGGGVLPYMGYTCKGMRRPKEYGFSAVLVININRVSILADFEHK